MVLFSSDLLHVTAERRARLTDDDFVFGTVGAFDIKKAEKGRTMLAFAPEQWAKLDISVWLGLDE